VSQPTWGVDVRAAAQLRQRLVTLRDAGAALLVVSEDLDELLSLCDALLVISSGRLSPRLRAPELSRERIGAWMGGSWESAPAVGGPPCSS
jgi:simple sugar transport system ATP-binding protein